MTNDLTKPASPTNRPWDHPVFASLPGVQEAFRRRQVDNIRRDYPATRVLTDEEILETL